jgi:chromosome segregation ATPase
LKTEKQNQFDEAKATKDALTIQIRTLEDLTHTYDDETILAEINAKIAEFTDEVTAAESAIEDAQEAFNLIAEQDQVIQQERAAALEKAAKDQEFLDAESHYQYVQSMIKDTEESLKYFG